MDREIEGPPTADYLWNVKQVVPFLKVDNGLAEEKNGVHLMKPMPQLGTLLNKAKAKRIFGTKMRSVINQADAGGIKEIVNQQFEVAAQIMAAGLVPIVEPEVDIHCPEKAKAEALLKAAILEKLNRLPVGQLVFLKLTLPEQEDFYADCRQTSQCGEGAGAIRRLFARGRQRAAAQKSRRCRELFAGVWSKDCRPSNPMPSSTRCWMQRFRASLRHPR